MPFQSTPSPLLATLRLPGGIPMSFCRIPAGSFRMGSWAGNADEKPVHRVRIGQPFWLGQVPVTQRQFRAWTQAAGIKHANHFEGRGDELPAENMHWGQANQFCAWLRNQVVLGSEMQADGVSLFCLPTEAEWEYACRAGTNTEYHTGDGKTALQAAGWFGEGGESGSTHPVGLKEPNALGLHDMHGNAREWCHDRWDAAAYRTRHDGVVDPGSGVRMTDWRAGGAALRAENRYRVLRGGSWNNVAGGCRAACRLGWRALGRFGYDGFRVCLVRGPAALTASRTGAEATHADGASVDGAGRTTAFP